MFACDFKKNLQQCLRKWLKPLQIIYPVGKSNLTGWQMHSICVRWEINRMWSRCMPYWGCCTTTLLVLAVLSGFEHPAGGLHCFRLESDIVASVIPAGCAACAPFNLPDIRILCFLLISSDWRSEAQILKKKNQILCFSWHSSTNNSVFCR